MILTKLGQAEDEIFRQRQIDEEKFKRRQKVGLVFSESHERVLDLWHD